MFGRDGASGGRANTGQFVTVAGVRLHYVRAGAGVPVVLLHGNAGFTQDYAALLQALPAQGYQAIAFDRPGHGLSERPTKEPATVEAQVGLLHAALRQLEIERPVLVAHSWSGALALCYALEYETELAALVLLAPAVYSDEADFAAESALVALPGLSDLLIKLSGPIIGRKIKSSLLEAFAPDPVPADYLQLAQAVWIRPSQIKAIVEDDNSFNATVQALSPRYSEVRIPTIIMTGDSDRLVAPEVHAYPLHRTLTQARLIVLPETGHMLPHTRPAAVLEAIQAVCAPGRAR